MKYLSAKWILKFFSVFFCCEFIWGNSIWKCRRWFKGNCKIRCKVLSSCSIRHCEWLKALESWFFQKTNYKSRTLRNGKQTVCELVQRTSALYITISTNNYYMQKNMEIYVKQLTFIIRFCFYSELFKR